MNDASVDRTSHVVDGDGFGLLWFIQLSDLKIALKVAFLVTEKVMSS